VGQWPCSNEMLKMSGQLAFGYRRANIIQYSYLAYTPTVQCVIGHSHGGSTIALYYGGSSWISGVTFRTDLKRSSESLTSCAQSDETHASNISILSSIFCATKPATPQHTHHTSPHYSTPCGLQCIYSAALVWIFCTIVDTQRNEQTNERQQCCLSPFRRTGFWL